MLIQNEIENFGLLVMEACDCSLESYVNKLEGKVLPEAALRDVCHDVCHAIVYLHGVRVAHRDIKPANILVCNSRVPGRRPTYKRKSKIIIIIIIYAFHINPIVLFIVKTK